MENKKATIYTATGDNGTTSLIGGTRVSKNHPRVEAYGTLDELNAHLGMLAAAVEDEETIVFIEEIENNLLTIGYILALETKHSHTLEEKEIKKLQDAIDEAESTLPPMHKFIIPCNGEGAARANLCRTVCRRAERRITTLHKEHPVQENIMIYINRLSDYLFLLSRQLADGNEKIWDNPCR
jgi:cob(I)alamin adenosyltransferase